MTARLDRVNGMARRPADVQMLALLSRIMGLALGPIEARDPAAAAAVRGVLERMSSGLSGEGLRLAPRDWQRWTDPR
jgi:hypothetical protein